MVTAEVLRDGKVTPLPLRMIVPGDVVELEAGRPYSRRTVKLIFEKDLFLNDRR